MKKNTNYGYPLSFILMKFVIFLFLTIGMFLLFIIGLNLYFVIILSIIVFILYTQFCIINFKKYFLKNRNKLLKRIIKLADLKGNETVLDLGTGSGFLAIGFAKNLKKGRSYGLDRYNIKYNSLKKRLIRNIKINFVGNSLKNALENAKIENVEKKCEFIQADLTKPIDFSDKKFDIIVSSQFFYCLSHRIRPIVFKEINRLLKKGGKIIFFESSNFMSWDLNEGKKYFESNGYKIQIIPIKEFKNCSILYGQK